MNSYLCIGHICHDLSKTGFRLGGTPSFARPWIEAFNYDFSLITSYGSDFKYKDWLKGINSKCIASKNTTVFENIYHKQKRSQFLRNKAERIKSKDIEFEHHNSDIIHFCPIADEIDYELLDLVSENKFVAATPQGWMRTTDENEKVIYQDINWSFLENLNAIVISEEDLPGNNENLGDNILPEQLFVITKGNKGAVAFHRGESYIYPAYPVESKFLTGAGDVFSAVLFIIYRQTEDFHQSIIAATCAASIHVEQGILVPKKLKLLMQDRIKVYKERFGFDNV